MFTASSLAEITVGSERPRRERAGEASEQTRAARQAKGRCIDCGERPFDLLAGGRRRFKRTQRCDKCRKRVEANTVRDANKHPRRGRLSIGDSDQADAKLALNAFVAGFSGLDAVTRRDDLTRRERTHHEGEPLSQLLMGVRAAFAVAKRRGLVDEWFDAIEQSLTRE